jgi:hypothetical protein
VFFQDIDVDDDLAKNTRDKFFPNMPILRIPRLADGPVGQCYHNVRKQIREHEGAAQLGWVLCFWPNQFVEALHHAIWIHPNGSLWDVTAPSYDGMVAPEVAFVRETPTRPLGEIDPFTPSWFMLLTDKPGIKDYVRLTRERTSLIDKMYSRGALVGQRFVNHDGQIGYEFPPNDLFVASYQQRLDSIDALRQRYFLQFRKGNLSKINA